MKTVDLIKTTDRVKKFSLQWENRPQRFSTKSQALKFAKNNDWKVNDLTPVAERNVKVTRWQ